MTTGTTRYDVSGVLFFKNKAYLAHFGPAWNCAGRSVFEAVGIGIQEFQSDTQDCCSLKEPARTLSSFPATFHDFLCPVKEGEDLIIKIASDFDIAAAGQLWKRRSIPTRITSCANHYQRPFCVPLKLLCRFIWTSTADTLPSMRENEGRCSVREDQKYQVVSFDRVAQSSQRCLVLGSWFCVLVSLSEVRLLLRSAGSVEGCLTERKDTLFLK